MPTWLVTYRDAIGPRTSHHDIGVQAMQLADDLSKDPKVSDIHVWRLYKDVPSRPSSGK